MPLRRSDQNGSTMNTSTIETFICLGCQCEVPADYSFRTQNYCYLCDPAITLDELLTWPIPDKNYTTPRNRLPADVTRCTGDSGKPENDFRRCPVREQCARFRDYFHTHLPYDAKVPRMFAPNNCQQFIQYTDEES